MGGAGQLWSVVEVESGRGLAMSHILGNILGKMSYSHKYLNVLNLLNVFTLGPDLKTSLYIVNLIMILILILILYAVRMIFYGCTAVR